MSIKKSKEIVQKAANQSKFWFAKLYIMLFFRKDLEFQFFLCRLTLILVLSFIQLIAK